MSGSRSGAGRNLRGGRKSAPKARSKPGPAKGYMIGGTVPWPEFGDGTPWTDALDRVRHTELTEEVGKLQWVEWCHPDGTHMASRDKVYAATKTRPGRVEPYPGDWFAVVTWDRRDQHDSLMARHLLTHLVPE